jgi:hypothetical protein
VHQQVDPKDWDTFEINDIPKETLIANFETIRGMGYDWLGAIWWAFPWARHRPGRYSCFESTAKMLGLPDAHKQGPFELIAWAVKEK